VGMIGTPRPTGGTKEVNRQGVQGAFKGICRVFA
jgi:hypothetical protein